MSYQAKWKDIKATTVQEVMIQCCGNFTQAGLLLNTHKDVVADIYKNKIPHVIVDYMGGKLLMKATPKRVKAVQEECA